MKNPLWKRLPRELKSDFGKYIVTVSYTHLRKHLGYVFQMYNLIPNLNVKENIEVGAYLSDKALDIDELLYTLGLYEHRHKPVSYTHLDVYKRQV